jgi:hypothetical protein
MLGLKTLPSLNLRRENSVQHHFLAACVGMSSLSCAEKETHGKKTITLCNRETKKQEKQKSKKGRAGDRKEKQDVYIYMSAAHRGVW